jgi:L-rhamnose mutarotase
MRVTLHTKLRPGCEQAYRDIHRTIPPELAEAQQRCGVHDWQIYLDGTDVFHVVEVDDYRAMRAQLRDDPVNIAWQAQVAPFFDVADSYDGDDDGLPEIWSLAGQRAPG